MGMVEDMKEQIGDEYNSQINDLIEEIYLLDKQESYVILAEWIRFPDKYPLEKKQEFVIKLTEIRDELVNEAFEELKHALIIPSIVIVSILVMIYLL